METKRVRAVYADDVLSLFGISICTWMGTNCQSTNRPKANGNTPFLIHLCG